jgi:hypothetical protein
MYTANQNSAHGSTSSGGSLSPQAELTLPMVELLVPLLVKFALSLDCVMFVASAMVQQRHGAPRTSGKNTYMRT